MVGPALLPSDSRGGDGLLAFIEYGEGQGKRKRRHCQGDDIADYEIFNTREQSVVTDLLAL